MPVHLEPLDLSAELEKFSSVLIVSCPVCPPMCLAMAKKSPFIEFFHRGLKTGAFEDYIQSIREPLEQRGILTDVYSVYMPCPMMCVWMKSQQNRLLNRARNYDAVVVLGCDSAAYTVREALRNSGCHVIQGMRMVGAANATMKFHFPLTIDLEMHPLPNAGGSDRQKTSRAVTS
jgi:hypothetical protein